MRSTGQSIVGQCQPRIHLCVRDEQPSLRSTIPRYATPGWTRGGIIASSTHGSQHRFRQLQDFVGVRNLLLCRKIRVSLVHDPQPPAVEPRQLLDPRRGSRIEKPGTALRCRLPRPARLPRQFAAPPAPAAASTGGGGGPNRSSSSCRNSPTWSMLAIRTSRRYRSILVRMSGT